MTTTAATKFRDLLLEILHCDPSLPNSGRLLTLTTDDWYQITVEAIRYRMAFQVKQFFDSQSQLTGVVPQVCMERLGADVRKILMNNLRQQAYLRDMLALLKEANTPVILLKGLWLGELVYRDLKARDTGDIDLLLHAVDMPRFTKLVIEHGFDVPSTTTNICDLAPISNEFLLIHPTRKSVFDIHWSMTLSPVEKPVDEEKFWQRSEIYTIAGMPCQTLCIEDHLLYLCFHAAVHHRFVYVGPRALLDIDRLVAEPIRTIDWQDLVARTRELSWDRCVWLMLDLTRQHLGSQVPKSVLDELYPTGGDGQSIQALVIDAIFLDQGRKGNLIRNILRIATERSLLKRVALSFERIFPSSEEMVTKFRTSVDSPGFRWLYMKRLGLLAKDRFSQIFHFIVRDVAILAEKERVKAIDRWIEGDAVRDQSA